jgi:hypothetical protein
MDGCYWSGGSEIKCRQLGQRGDADSILPVRSEVISPQDEASMETAEALGIGWASVTGIVASGSFWRFK